MTKAQEESGKGKTAYNVEAKRKEMPSFRPSDIIVDWEANTSAACPYKLDEKPCCFCDEDVVDLVSREDPTSLLNIGQQSPLSVYMNAQKRPVLSAGFRRLYAFLLLERQGLLDQVPVAHGKAGQGLVECLVVEQPKDAEGHRRLALQNLAENKKRPKSPLDIAWALRRFAWGPDRAGGEHGLGNEKAGEAVAALLGKPLSGRMVARYLQLLSCSMAKQGKVHRYEMTLDDALRDASAKGEGRATGARPGVPHTKLRAIPRGALAEIVGKRESSEQRVLTPKEVENFALWLAGAPDVKPPSWGPKLLEAAEEAARAAKVEAGKKKAPRRKGEVAA